MTVILILLYSHSNYIISFEVKTIEKKYYLKKVIMVEETTCSDRKQISKFNSLGSCGLVLALNLLATLLRSRCFGKRKC